MCIYIYSVYVCVCVCVCVKLRKIHIYFCNPRTWQIFIPIISNSNKNLEPTYNPTRHMIFSY